MKNINIIKLIKNNTFLLPIKGCVSTSLPWWYHPILTTRYSALSIETAKYKGNYYVFLDANLVIATYWHKVQFINLKQYINLISPLLSRGNAAPLYEFVRSNLSQYPTLQTPLGVINIEPMYRNSYLPPKPALEGREFDFWNYIPIGIVKPYMQHTLHPTPAGMSGYLAISDDLNEAYKYLRSKLEHPIRPEIDQKYENQTIPCIGFGLKPVGPNGSDHVHKPWESHFKSGGQLNMLHLGYLRSGKNPWVHLRQVTAILSAAHLLSK